METVEAEVVAVEPVKPATIVRAAPGDVVEAFKEYQRIQQTLDAALPDCIMSIRGKRFRKKNYWRAIATAFNLTVQLQREERITDPTRKDAGLADLVDWGWLVTYRATAPNGRSSDGDGTCMASEKADGQDTLHNVRSHAHTRAFNRAVSNLVGFGEVSAEEARHEGGWDDGDQPAAPAPKKAAAQDPPADERKITEKQQKLFWFKCSERAESFKDGAVTRIELAKDVLAVLAIEHTADIPARLFDRVLELVKNWQPGAYAEQPTAEQPF